VTRLFIASRRPGLRALTTSIVPETALATDAQWAALEATVERAISAKPASLRRQLGWLLRLVDAAARIRYGRPLERLSSARRLELLEGLAKSRVLLLRRGIWGLRTLLMLGWYTQSDVAAELGYRASPAGWDVRR
jgi:hypothetical protein